MNFVFRISDDPEPRRPKQHRAFKPKVRTGCQTCKKRRVKCDETKPTCNKCLLLGATCEGYASEFQIAPKRRVKEVSKHLQDLPLLTLEHFPEAARFNDETEFQYFRHFRQQTIWELSGSGGCDPIVWTSIIFQACEKEPALRRLMISVGALSKATSEQSEPSHYEYAVQQYGKALRGIQAFISNSQECESETTRIALIASLMIFCFESQHGDSMIARKHLQSALRLLQKRLSMSTKSFSHIRDGSPISDLEYELVSAFIRMDYHLVANVESSGINSHHRNILKFSYIREPSCPYARCGVFGTLLEARHHFDHLVHRYLWNAPQSLRASTSNASELSGLEDPQNMSFPLYHSLVAENIAWSKAFEPLLERSSQPECSEFVQVTVLHVQSLCLKLVVHSFVGLESPQNSLKVNNLIYISRKIVDLSRNLVRDARFHRKFAFETGIIQALFTVAVVCPKISVIKEATEVLRSIIPRRENVWDSAECVKTCEFLIAMKEDHTGSDLEGDNCDEGTAFTIPVEDEWRYKRLNVSCDNYLNSDKPN